MVWSIVFLSFVLASKGKKDYGKRLYPIVIYFANLQL